MISRRRLLMALAQRARKPNIVLLLLDDLGWGDLGCYGQKLIRTPNIDRAAREGTRYTQCYAGGAVCAPSRSVLMSGLHAGHAPVRANAGTVPIAEDDVTVAQVLKEAGYATGGFGKWGLGDAGSTGVPWKHGFDEFYGYLHQIHAHSYYPDFLWDNGVRHEVKGRYSADLISQRSLDFIEKNRRGPFFLYACTTLPHARFEIPSVAPYESEPWTQGQKTYAAMVTAADRYAGRILDALGRHGLDRDTLVLISSDNGAPSGDGKGYELFRSNGGLRGEKGTLYEGGIRVPMIARWPGVVPAGRTSGFVWSFCAFMPTCAELAVASAPRGIDGASVVAELRGRKQKPHPHLYWEHLTHDRQTNRLNLGRMEQAARFGDWKARRARPDAPVEIYNLATDPGESADLAVKRPDLVSRGEAIFKAAHSQPRPHDNGSYQFAS
jgi:arylsulfatase A-like enzyme